MAKHLEVLGGVIGGRFGIIEVVGEADTLDRRLGHTLDDRWRLNAKRVEHRRYHVDGVGVLRADFTLCRDAFGPVYDERVADSASVGLALPATERCIARPCPAPGVVVEGRRPTQMAKPRTA